MKFDGKMFQGELDRIYWMEEERQENLVDGVDGVRPQELTC